MRVGAGAVVVVVVVVGYVGMGIGLDGDMGDIVFAPSFRVCCLQE